MTVKIKIAGEDRSSLIIWDSLEIVFAITKEVDICSFRLKKYAGQTYSPSVNDEVEIYDGDTKIYGGVIIETEETSEGLVREISVTCKDYSHYLDRKLVVKDYPSDRTENLYAGDIVKNIIQTTCSGYGFTTNNVSTGPKIESIKFNYDLVSKAFEDICKQVGYDWYVDENKDIHFFEKEERIAPFELTDDNESFVWNSLVIRRDLSQIKNAIYVRGGDYTNEITAADAEVYVADGQQRIFHIGRSYNLDTTFTVEKSTDGGTTWIGLDEGQYGKDKPEDFDVLYDPDKRFVIFREDNKPANGNYIRVYGKETLPIIVYIRDEPSVSKYGEFQFREVDKTIKSKEEAKQRALSILEDYKEKASEGTFITYKDGLEVGQKIHINSAIRGIDEWFQITKIIMKIRNPESGKKEYNVTVVGSEQIGIIDVLTKLLVSEPNKNITISTGEILDKIFAVSENINVSEQISKVAAVSITDSVSASENIRKDPWGAGVAPTWVLGPYPTGDDTDSKRPIFLNQGAWVY